MNATIIIIAAWPFAGGIASLGFCRAVRVADQRRGRRRLTLVSSNRR